MDQITGLAAHRPMLAVYEDVHWADPTTLKLLESVIERVRTLPMLVIITCRPEFSPRWSGHAHLTLLTLSRLGRRQGTSMVEQLTGGKALPAEVLAQVLARTDGVPLFVEELTKLVLESGLLVEESDATFSPALCRRSRSRPPCTTASWLASTGSLRSSKWRKSRPALVGIFPTTWSQ